jgi:hypothetical protein
MVRGGKVVHVPAPRGLIQARRRPVSYRRRGHLAVIPWTGHVGLMVMLLRMRGSMLGMLSLWGPLMLVVRLVLWVRHVWMLWRGAFHMQVVHPLSVGRIVLRSVSRPWDPMLVLVRVGRMQRGGRSFNRRRAIWGVVAIAVIMRRSGAGWVLLGPGMM